MKQLTIVLASILFPAISQYYWGFFGHKKINEHAIYSLPPEMIRFYKENVDFIILQSVAPDKRRYAIPEEAPRHYIDLDSYPDSLPWKGIKYWSQAEEFFTKDTLLSHGIVPWHVQLMQYRLTEAFRVRDGRQILKISAELGHYIADANVPLHTTSNYNGQQTNQHGIHGLWESRLPELFFVDYDLWIGQAEYVPDTHKAIWNAVLDAHNAVDSVLSIDENIKRKFKEDQWFSYEQRGIGNVRVFSAEYSKAYHDQLNGMVERQLRRSIKMVADFWFTAWVDAGQPNLSNLDIIIVQPDSLYQQNQEILKKGRLHEY